MNLAPFSNPITSRDAAREIARTLSHMEIEVMACFRETYATAEDVELETGFRPSTVSARIRGLVIAGRLEDSGVRAKNTRGRMMILWRIVTTAPRQMDLLGA